MIKTTRPMGDRSTPASCGESIGAMRRARKSVRVKDIVIGNGAPVSIQSMTTTPTVDINATVAQIKSLLSAGCQIVRVAAPDEESARAIGAIKREVDFPLIADIHFNHKIALVALENGADGLRLNPGNIGEKSKVEQIARAALERAIPIRVGVNFGSIPKKLLDKHNGPTVDAAVEAALEQISILEAARFDLIKVSAKSSSVRETVATCRALAEKIDYPLHIGVTEAGTPRVGAIKSAIGIGSLLLDGIGDTIRVSLTSDPVEEVHAAKAILRSVGLRSDGAEIISCPTCARAEIDIIGLAQDVERRLESVKSNIKVAVMGCIVNGPGEARHADVGIAAGKGTALIFRDGAPVRRAPENFMRQALFEEIDALIANRERTDPLSG